MSTTNQEKSKRSRRRFIFPLILLILGAAGTGYFYLRLNSAERSHRENLEAMEGEYERQLQTEAERIESESAQLFMQALGWAVRKSMMRQNLDEVDQYVFDMVQNEPVQEVLVLNESGQIIKASEKKLEGTSWSEHPRTMVLSSSDIQIQRVDSLLLMSAPLYGPTEYLGHVVLFSQRKTQL
jgi:glutathione synthase/RimK-type ligase-like ATP-grasp enzyme